MNATTSQQLEQMLINALDAITRNDVGPWASMFTEDGVMEFPYAPPGSPDRVEGRANLVTYLARFPEMIKYEHISHPMFHHSGNVLIAEFSADGKGVKTGYAFNQRYISVIEHRAGKIVRYVDYWNPLVVQKVMGDTTHE
jgi:ketosteroid isomerase-like protein